MASDAALNEKIRLFIDEEFNSLSLPSFIDNLTVTNFSLGDLSPEITIRHIGDPFEEFYGDYNSEDEIKKHTLPQLPSLSHQDDSDDSSTEDESERSANLKSIHSKMAATEPEVVQPQERLRKGLDLVRHLSNYNMNNLGLGPPELDLPASIFQHGAYRLQAPPVSSGKKSAERSANDIQFMLEIDFQSGIEIELKINLLVNYPLAHFILLPVKLRITDLAIHSLAAVAYLEKKVFISILCDLNDSAADYFTSASSAPPARDHSTASTHGTPAGGNFVDYSAGSTRERIDVIRNIKIDTEIGEVENNVLRNVGKIEKFLVEQLRNIIRDEICWPGWLCFDLNAEDEEEEEEEAPAPTAFKSP